MLRKNLIVIVLSIFLLINITAFFDGSFESIFNLAISVFLIIMLYIVISKYDYLEMTDKNNNLENEKIIRYMCLFLLPITTLLFIFIHPGVIFNYLILLAIQFIIYLISRNVKLACTIQVLFSYILYVVSEILIITRGTPLVPMDILSANLALSLTNGYEFDISSNLARATIAMFTTLFLVGKLVKNTASKEEKRKLSIVSLTLSIAIVLIVLSVDITAYQDIQFDAADSIRNRGLIFNFYLNTKYLILEEPEDYSKEYAKEILSNYVEDVKSGDNELPNIIVIMNESFSDLEKIMELDTNIDSLEYFYSLKENTVRGNLIVPVIGGSTSVVEMEFLTGFSIEFFKEGSNPYMQQINKKTNSIVWDLKNQGYSTFALHPYYEHAYKRKDVYNYLGFDDFISIEDLVGKENINGYKYLNNIGSDEQSRDWEKLDTVRNYVSDRANFNEIIKIYENSPDKTFIFNVTMQNHWPYTYDGEDFKNVVVDKKINDPELNQYLSLIHESDKALEEFISYFEENSERKTIILFFGDHYPWLRDAYSVGLSINDIGDIEKKDYMDITTIPFFIWANYDIEEKYVGKIGTQYLSVLLKETAGIPLTSWDKFRKETMEKYPAFNFIGTYDSFGKLLDNVNNLKDESFEKYKMLQYYFLEENE